MPDMDGIVDYARSLAVAEIGILLIEQENSVIRVSLRSKGADVSKVAVCFGGGGHKVAAGFTVEQIPLQEITDTILKEITLLGLTDGEKKQR
jgi:phosphoesterase RecJ-like protein